MKRILYTLLLVSGVSSAQMYFDIRTRMCCTYPASDNIDQNQYNDYTTELYWELYDLWISGRYSNTCMWRLACVNAKKRAEADNTPTAQQFVVDLDEIPSLQEFEDLLGL